MTKDQPLITVGIPFFNAEEFLEYAINSVLNQSYTNWELLLLDDGSTDNSLSIADYFKNKDRRITVISDGENHGLPYRLNELSDLATGEYYCRMDADDMMHPNRLEHQLDHFFKHPELDLLGTGLIAIDNDNEIIGLRKGKNKSKYQLDDIIYGGWCAHPTIMGKTKWFKKNQYDVSLKRSQDFDLWVRTVGESNFAMLKQPYLYYREASTPTLKKYFKATKYSIYIYCKNKAIIGLVNCIKLTLIRIIKLGIYLIYWCFGQTNKLIKRRSISLNMVQKEKHTNIINSICSLGSFRKIT